ncbi:T9SS type A sorting domain-containing protein [uncultured Kordia sp.]|uniref:leucine-rich repeat domain-containing protein n=1 Tax=uncultured Kordia sp. TaxID=507699 RepID=UPI0026144193|nr:T9SS type A sorting domain-containing protein [uncultured Kordia sp.]
MKLRFLYLVILLITIKLQAQIVNIPDANFKAYLVGNTAVNTNGDGEIQVSEANSFSGIIYPNNRSIADLTGIEAFTALTGLYCNNNQLTSLDVSANTALTILDCHRNQLTSIDIASNTALTHFDCNNNSISVVDVSTNVLLEKLYVHFNQLTAIDVSVNTALLEIGTNSNPITSLNLSTNTALTAINCNSNLLTSLDVSANTDVLYLYCSYNMLSSLDVSANTMLVRMYCNNNLLTSLNVANGFNNTITGANINMRSNPNLACVTVDDIAYSNTNWANKDATTAYGTNCGTLTVAEVVKKMIHVYPNPAKDFIHIEMDSVLKSARLYTVLGTIMTKVNSKTIDVSKLAKGIYILQIETQNGAIITKQISKQ